MRSFSARLALDTGRTRSRQDCICPASGLPVRITRHNRNLRNGPLELLRRISDRVTGTYLGKLKSGEIEAESLGGPWYYASTSHCTGATWRRSVTTRSGIYFRFGFDIARSTIWRRSVTTLRDLTVTDTMGFPNSALRSRTGRRKGVLCSLSGKKISKKAKKRVDILARCGIMNVGRNNQSSKGEYTK